VGTDVNGCGPARSDHTRRATAIRGSWQAKPEAAPGHPSSMITGLSPSYTCTDSRDHGSHRSCSTARQGPSARPSLPAYPHFRTPECKHSRLLRCVTAPSLTMRTALSTYPRFRTVGLKRSVHSPPDGASMSLILGWRRPGGYWGRLWPAREVPAMAWQGPVGQGLRAARPRRGTEGVLDARGARPYPPARPVTGCWPAVWRGLRRVCASPGFAGAGRS